MTSCSPSWPSGTAGCITRNRSCRSIRLSLRINRSRLLPIVSFSIRPCELFVTSNGNLRAIGLSEAFCNRPRHAEGGEILRLDIDVFLRGIYGIARQPEGFEPPALANQSRLRECNSCRDMLHFRADRGRPWRTFLGRGCDHLAGCLLPSPPAHLADQSRSFAGNHRLHVVHGIVGHPIERLSMRIVDTMVRLIPAPGRQIYTAKEAEAVIDANQLLMVAPTQRVPQIETQADLRVRRKVAFLEKLR